MPLIKLVNGMNSHLQALNGPPLMKSFTQLHLYVSYSQSQHTSVIPVLHMTLPSVLLTVDQ